MTDNTLSPAAIGELSGTTYAARLRGIASALESEELTGTVRMIREAAVALERLTARAQEAERFEGALKLIECMTETSSDPDIHHATQLAIVGDFARLALSPERKADE